MSGTVIIGAGQAGLQTAASLRQGGYDEPITLVGDEDALPYQRPPLSKAYLKPGYNQDRLLLRAERFFVDNKIKLHTGTKVVAIDRSNCTVLTDDCQNVPYRQLVLALGARNRAISISGSESPRIHQLRSLRDADALRDALDHARRLTVIGGGFIGLEIAAVCRSMDCEVTVLEGGPRLMARAVSPDISAFFLAAHRQMGTRVQLGASVEAICDRGETLSVRTAASGDYESDLVLMAAGVLPNVELAEHAGLGVDDGILVGADFRTADPHIFAVGDCARFADGAAGNRRRLESVQSAIAQAKSVASQILGNPAHPLATPWFWSEQGTFKLQIVGDPNSATTFIRSATTERSITTYCLKGDRLVGVETVNNPATHMVARKVMELDPQIHPTELKRPDFDLKSFA